ncbi:MAG: hypothetical protein A3K19_23310 [Lentisphaerae bacterium RIFOXYB12_FULL_65_16]|nr:MAG: hypothetical protein A3K19_23310 [Lentisphaerae bacterium RIFOXYB12_FULL_65_16]
MSDQPELSHGLGDLARDTGLHPATCSHLVNTMVERGYLKRAGPRKGYQLGPMAYYLVRNGAYRNDLVSRAEPQMKNVAEELGEWVVLTAMAGMRRLVLLELNGTRGRVQLDRQALRLAEKAYDSASIWLFLAHMGPEERQRFVEQNGLPDCTRSALETRLTGIRKAGVSVYQDDSGEVAKVACPVQEHGAVIGAVGVHLPAFRFTGEHRRKILARTADLAARISVVS